MMNIKIPSKINIYLFFIFSILIFSNISYAENEESNNNMSLENMLNTQVKDNNLTEKKNTPIKAELEIAYGIHIPKFMPTPLPKLYPSKSKVSNRVQQISDEIQALSQSTKKLYTLTIENQNHNNQIYTQYRKIIDSTNATLDTGHSLPGDPELTQKINIAYELLENIKHTLAILQTLNMEVIQQANINEFLVASIKRTRNIEVANNNDKLNLKQLAKIIVHNTLYLKLFKNNFKDIMINHQLLISHITTEISRVNAGVIAGKSIKIIFHEHQEKVGKITLPPPSNSEHENESNHYMIIKSS